MPANASYSADGSVLHMLIAGAAHHQDLRFSDPADPPALTIAKKAEFGHICRWLAGNN